MKRIHLEQHSQYTSNTSKLTHCTNTHIQRDTFDKGFLGVVDPSTGTSMTLVVVWQRFLCYECEKKLMASQLISFSDFGHVWCQRKKHMWIMTFVPFLSKSINLQCRMLNEFMAEFSTLNIHKGSGKQGNLDIWLHYLWFWKYFSFLGWKWTFPLMIVGSQLIRQGKRMREGKGTGGVAQGLTTVPSAAPPSHPWGACWAWRCGSPGEHICACLCTRRSSGPAQGTSGSVRSLPMVSCKDWWLRKRNPNTKTNMLCSDVQ